MYGSAIGFLNKPCAATPAIPSIPPVTMAAIVLGNRKTLMIIRSPSVHVTGTGIPTLEHRIPHTFSISISTLPIANDRKMLASNPMGRKIRIIFFMIARRMASPMFFIHSGYKLCKLQFQEDLPFLPTHR
jgi:hypothetical protein